VFKKLALVSLLCVASTAHAKQSVPSTPAKPLTQQQVLALVAGQSLPENISAEIRTLGIAFSPDAAYFELLATASVPPSVLNALKTAHSTPSAVGVAGNATALRHLALAGQAISANRLELATQELNLALSAGADRNAVGFIGGLILMSQNQWQKAGEVYSEIAKVDTDFPQLHTRLSATSYHLEDYVSMLREAKTALRQIPTDPAAHLNAGLALMNLGKLDAAKLELQASIENKPDYIPGYGGLAYILDQQGDRDGAIAQYKKALALQPNDTHDRYNMAVAYMNKEDWAAAIRELRIVKSQDPQNLDARQNLGSCLLHIDPLAAVTEFKELTAISPSFSICHDCLGAALAQARRYPEAEKEYANAIELDPGAASPHLNLGLLLEIEEKYDQALLELRIAEKLDPDNARAFTHVGRILLEKKDFPGSIAELEHAEELAPADWFSRDLHGRALQADGKVDAAVVEFSEAVSLGPKELQARLDLAHALEKKGDWVAALANYQQAAENELMGKPHPTSVAIDTDNTYKAALARYKQHLADLRASGNEKQAADLESRLAATMSKSGSGDQYQTAMLDGIRAMRERRWVEAVSAFKQARDVAEKIRPMDNRLPEVYGKLANVYQIQGQNQDAELAYRRQLALYEQLNRPDSPTLLPALKELGEFIAGQKKLSEAQALLERAVAISTASYGENSNAAEDSVTNLARLFLAEQDFKSAQTSAQRVVKIAEALYGPDDSRMASAVSTLCIVFDVTRNATRGEPCHARMIALEEKEYGADSPRLAMELTAEARTLRELGRTSEAANVEARAQSLGQPSQQQPH
jgi:tetratricopeptide (TPR) repeat protein